MNDNNLNLLLYRIAGYYYNDNLSQNEIAKIENVSRSQISRLLIMARERGIVDIRLCLPEMDTEATEKKLSELLSVPAVMVSQSVPSGKTSGDDEVVKLSTFASSLLPELLEDCSIIGLGWGRTLYNISMQLPIVRKPADKLFLPLVGNSGTHNQFLQTSSIVNHFSERFAASAFYANFACIYNTGLLPKSYFEASIGQLNRYWDTLDAAIFSVGPRPEGDSFYIDEVEAAGISRKSDLYQRVTGEMLGHLYGSDGQIDWSDHIPKDYEFVGVPLSKLRKTPKTICIATGIDKVEALIHAARNGYFNTLITDQMTAQGIIEHLEETK